MTSQARSLTRRRFLGLAGGAAGATAGGVAWWPDAVRDRAAVAPTTLAKPGPSRRAAPPDSVLVVVQCAGGNDGLNTLVPVTDGRYRDARPTLAVPEADLVPLAGSVDHAVHPSLAALVPLWDAGDLAFVQTVGFPDAGRSHFAALDSWWSGDPEGATTDGWLGRWLAATADDNPMRGIALGGGAPLLRTAAATATVVSQPRAFSLRTPPGVDGGALVDGFLATAAPLAADPLFAAAQSVVPETVDAVDLLDGAGLDAPPGGRRGARSGQVTSLLDVAAQIIGLDVGTRVVVVGIGGYDTHASQAGTHAALLDDLGGGIAAFFDALAAQGDAERVVLMTISEFGRRVVENGSGGTDHGRGGVQCLVGRAVAGGVTGAVDLGDLDDGDLRPDVDPRSLYQVALDWLGGPTEEIVNGRYDDLGLIA